MYNEDCKIEQLFRDFMFDIQQYFTDIENLTEKINSALIIENFEEVSILLEQRLTQLKALDSQIKINNLSKLDHESYNAFLRNLQEIDKKKVETLNIEKNRLFKQSIQQSKNNIAIGKYKSIGRK